MTGLDQTDRRLINALLDGFPISARPFAEIGRALGLSEDETMTRLQSLLDRRVVNRFGPFFNAEAMGGAVTLAAMAVPEERFDEIAEVVNGFPEVAHNYQRTHALNMWFVVACQQPSEIATVLRRISEATGLDVIDLPKEEEYFLELKLTA
jgi:DNA-binding Lrp family transcriptional regulator